MQDWYHVALRFHDSLPLIVLNLIACGVLVGWLVFQTLRSAETRGEMARLRRKLADLEVERAYAYSGAAASAGTGLVDPVVLSPRWVRKGSAATTSDGGCLVIVDDLAPQARTAVLTLRVDGTAIHVRHKVRTGHSLQAEGSMGMYTVQVSAVEQLRTIVGVSLRNRHAQAAS